MKSRYRLYIFVVSSKAPDRCELEFSSSSRGLMLLNLKCLKSWIKTQTLIHQD